MTTHGWFDDVPVLGKLRPEEAALKLREIGEVDAAVTIETARAENLTFGSSHSWWPFQDRAWQHTAHAFGYLSPTSTAADFVPIRHAGNILADPSLKRSRVKITLDRLRVADYPGGGTHRILFDFYAMNQLPGVGEPLHFNASFRVREGEQAAIIGFPIFVGLNVDADGVAFKCFTVNVQNDGDEALLSFLDSDVFKGGLKLATVVQPAISLLSETALGLTKAIAKRNRNVPVQDFYMGLDFSNIATGARLAEGSYVAVQIPESFQSIWNWNDWLYNPGSGQVVSQEAHSHLIPYNYLVFGVSRYQGANEHPS
jgi:hypothetical protein